MSFTFVQFANSTLVKVTTGTLFSMVALRRTKINFMFLNVILA